MLAENTGRGAVQRFENSVEIADASETASVADVCNGKIFVPKHAAGLLKPQNVYKAFEVHTEAIVKKRRKIVVFVI